MASLANHVVGVDIGGANVKYATTDGLAMSSPFAMWRTPEQLADVLSRDLIRLSKQVSQVDALAVTMTGELADCFADRAVGVKHIVDHMCRAASQLGIRQAVFYGVDGRFRDAHDAAIDADHVAAANWHALASFVARDVAGDGTLIDVGSTTTDIIPISAGRVATSATTDFDRLREGSLVYIGCRRTPVCALVDELNFRGHAVGVMNELFATIDDARLLLRSAPPDPDDCDTADSKPRTRPYAANRIARMIGLDRRTVSVDDAVNLASQVVIAARQRIHRALNHMPPQSAIILSGHGDDLIELTQQQTVFKLSRILEPEVSRCAPSYAVASLYSAQETFVSHQEKCR